MQACTPEQRPKGRWANQGLLELPILHLYSELAVQVYNPACTPFRARDDVLVSKW